MDHELNIYVVTKNAVRFPPSPPFRAIQGGAALTETRIPGAITDDSGDNVSRYNEFYAEISSMYWVWKNAEPSTYVGFFHYRRFLNFGAQLCPDRHWSERNFFDFERATLERFGWTAEAALEAVAKCDLVLPQREMASRPPYWDRECSLYTHYRNSHVTRDINLALQIIKEMYPQDYALAESVIQSNSGYFCQLFVMKWDVFDAYMAWLMPILEAVRKRIDVHAPIYGPETGQTRMLGFLAERLLNIFIERCRLQGKIIREFERLFGKFPDDWSVPLKMKTQSRPRTISRFRKGISISAAGWKLDIFSPD